MENYYLKEPSIKVVVAFANWDRSDETDIDVIIQKPRSYLQNLPILGPEERHTKIKKIDFTENWSTPTLRQFHYGFCKLLDYMVENDYRLPPDSPEPTDEEHEWEAAQSEVFSIAGYWQSAEGALDRIAFASTLDATFSRDPLKRHLRELCTPTWLKVISSSFYRFLNSDKREKLIKCEWCQRYHYVGAKKKDNRFCSTKCKSRWHYWENRNSTHFA